MRVRPDPQVCRHTVQSPINRRYYIYFAITNDQAGNYTLIVVGCLRQAGGSSYRYRGERARVQFTADALKTK